MIRFSKYIWLYILLSAIVLVPGLFALVRFGLRPSIDFTGGTLVEVRTTASQDSVERAAHDAGFSTISIVPSGGDIYLLRLRDAQDAQVTDFSSYLASASAAVPEILRHETVGPVLGEELLVKAITAAVFAMAVILAYVAYAFRNIKFGVSAVVALLHDLLVVLGAFALLGHLWHVEVDTLFVTAVLTTMSFSVHDTIVVFDRMREHRKRERDIPLAQLADRALMETMNRSLINSLTILFMLLALLLVGGETIRWFVAALFIGTISGTYSSPFVAMPMLLWLDRWEKRRH